MYCSKCGTKIADNAKFCANCGEIIQGNKPKKIAKKANNRLIGIIAVLLVAVVVLLAGVKLSNRHSVDKTAEKVLEAFSELDLTKIYALYPKPVQEWLLAEEELSEEEYIQTLIERNEELAQTLSAAGSVLNLEWSCTGINDCTELEFLSMAAVYEHTVGITITDAKQMNVSLTVNAWGIENTQKASFYLIKYKGSWYVDYNVTNIVF